jgi:alpha-beta hydrolase superfamily lysophospholipase
MARNTKEATSSKAMPDVVDPAWLLKAVGVTLVGALACGYLTLCLLIYQGQWQMVLHPVVGATVAPAGVQAVRFGAAESGQPRLAGWWIPAISGMRDRYTVLHDGTGNLEANAGALETLHGAGLNVFGFDYRGFGESDPTHPNEVRMTEDAEAALDYLVNTRHLGIETIVPYGVGTGAALAVHLAEQHQAMPGMVIESPQPDVLAMVRKDPRAGLVPMSMLFHERFEMGPGLRRLATPKLVLTAGPSPVDPVPDTTQVDALAKMAGSPSLTVHLERPVRPSAYTEALNRFFDEYLHP